VLSRSLLEDGVSVDSGSVRHDGLATLRELRGGELRCVKYIKREFYVCNCSGVLRLASTRILA
jgi:hypothetical protein